MFPKKAILITTTGKAKLISLGENWQEKINELVNDKYTDHTTLNGHGWKNESFIAWCGDSSRTKGMPYNKVASKLCSYMQHRVMIRNIDLYGDVVLTRETDTDYDISIENWLDIQTTIKSKRTKVPRVDMKEAIEKKQKREPSDNQMF